VIPYGIDLKAFSPRDRGFARETLGIPANAFVMAFVADFVTGPRKGFAVLTQALDMLAASLRNDVWLISVGGGHPVAPAGYRSAHFGRVHNDRLLSLFYSAADVFVLPTLEDNLPTTVLESLACGTPVLGSDVGGVPDMVRHGETGWLFPVGDAAALASRLGELIPRVESVGGMRNQCRTVAEREYAAAIQAGRYQSLYRELSSRG
jgi:glycosyltransferase involved in cell wall biosynthesis